MPRKKKIPPVLEAVPQETDLKKLSSKNTFWNTCPRKLKAMPESACEMGKASCQKVDHSPCPWAVNSEGDHYCFWVMLQRRSDPEGNMAQLKQDECARLLNWSSTRVHFTTKDAIQSIKNGPFASFLAILNKEKAPEEDDLTDVASEVVSGLPPEPKPED